MIKSDGAPECETALGVVFEGTFYSGLAKFARLVVVFIFVSLEKILCLYCSAMITHRTIFVCLVKPGHGIRWKWRNIEEMESRRYVVFAAISFFQIVDYDLACSNGQILMKSKRA